MIPSYPCEITTERLLLRSTLSDDAARAYEIRRNWNVSRNLSHNCFPPVAEIMAEWFAGHAGEWRDQLAYRFAIIKSEQMVGVIDINDVHASVGELGYWLDEAVWGQGIAREAGEAVIRFAFSEVGLTKLVAGYAADNLASGKVLARLGFRDDGAKIIYSKARAVEVEQRRVSLQCEHWHGDGGGGQVAAQGRAVI